MKDILMNASYFGVFLSLGTYFAGVQLKKKFKSGLLNPLLIAILLTILILCLTGVDYDTYNSGANKLSFLLTPATICLAIPLYEQLSILKNNFKAVLAGILSGVVTSLLTILGMAALFHFSHAQYVTFLPKSITTAIGMGVSEELGGFVPITVAVIIITGVIGNVIAEGFFKLLKIEEPVAKGIALGTASHAIGTAKAMELGEIEGALSSLSIVVAGMFTVVGANLFAGLW